MTTTRDKQAFKRMADATARKYTLYNLDDASVLALGGVVGGKRPDGADALLAELLDAVSNHRLVAEQTTETDYFDHLACMPPRERGLALVTPFYRLQKWMAVNHPQDAYFSDPPSYSKSKAAGPQAKLLKNMTMDLVTVVGHLLRQAKFDDPAGFVMFRALVGETVKNADVIYSDALKQVPAQPASDHRLSTTPQLSARRHSS